MDATGTSAGANRRLIPPRIGCEQALVLRRLTGRWLLLRDGEAVRWCSDRGYPVPPFRTVRRSVVESLARHGCLRPVTLRAGRRYLSISNAGLQALARHDRG